jgi:diguanylate cyclase (GGDEF)-like protein
VLWGAGDRDHPSLAGRRGFEPVEAVEPVKPSQGDADMNEVSDETSLPVRPVAGVRPLLLLLLVVAGSHAAAAPAGALSGGWKPLATVADAALAAILLVGVVVAALAPPRTLSPARLQVAAVVAIGLAGLVSGVRASASGQPWAGGDVVLAVLAAVVLTSSLHFVIAVAAAELSWLVAVLVGMATGAAGMAAWQWVLLGVVMIGPVAVALELRRALEGVLTRLEVAERTAVQQAVTDPLTGVTNRRGLELMALPMIEHARRQGEAAHCLFIDLDGFRVVNDTLGRGSGDEVLTAVCEAVLASVRATDIVARWAGDQFVVVGPGTGTSPLEMERRVRGQLTDAPPVPQDIWDGRVSIGSATLVPWDDGNIDSLLRRAEEDMRLRRSLRRQSRARSMDARFATGEPVGPERRGNPPRTPPAAPTVPNDH